MTLRPLLTSCPNYEMLLVPNPPHPLLGLFLPQNLSSLSCSHFHGTPFFSLTPATALAALPPRVWVGSALGLVWLARKINSLPTDGSGVRRRGGAAERLIPRRGAGSCLPAPCKHAAEGRQTFPPVYLSNIGSGPRPRVCDTVLEELGPRIPSAA